MFNCSRIIGAAVAASILFLSSTAFALQCDYPVLATQIDTNGKMYVQQAGGATDTGWHMLADSTVATADRAIRMALANAALLSGKYLRLVFPSGTNCFQNPPDWTTVPSEVRLH